MATQSPKPTLLRMRLLNVPGWRATIDGQVVSTAPFAGVMLQVKVPAGDHTVVLTYWPKAFSVGLLLTVVAVGALMIGRWRSSSGFTVGPRAAPTGMKR